MNRKTNTQTVRNVYTGSSNLHKLAVIQLQEKLNDHNVVYDKTDKKTVLIDLCIQHDFQGKLR